MDKNRKLSELDEWRLNTKLLNAAGRDDEATVRECIKAGATVDWRSKSLTTALHAAARKGHNNVIRLLEEAGWSLELRCGAGQTPLATAAVDGRLETVKYLLLRGANIDAQCNHKETALHGASSYGHADVVGHLLMAGANQEIKNREGKTAKDLAQESYSNDETRAALRKAEMGKFIVASAEEMKGRVIKRARRRGAAGAVEDTMEAAEPVGTRR